MKKNKMMRLASALLVLVLLTTCAISGTFAKYVTEGEKATETARVAKWGVTIEVSGDDAFAKNYKDEATDVEADITVASSTDDEVVAPGTKGTLFTMAVEGKPEVDTEITINANLALTGWEVDGAFYCPIVFTIGTTTVKQDDTITSAALMEAAIEDAIKEQTGTYQANEDLASEITIAWEWPFGDPDNNVKDTALGDAAAAGNAATIALDADITVAQID